MNLKFIGFLFTFVIFLMFSSLISNAASNDLKIENIKIYPSDRKVTIEFETSVLANKSIVYSGNLGSFNYVYSNPEFLTEHSAVVTQEIFQESRYELYVKVCAQDSAKCVVSRNFTFFTIRCGVSWRCFNESNIGYVNDICTWDLGSLKYCPNGCSSGSCNGYEGKGAIYVNSRPEGAIVYLDGKVLTLTPDVLLGLMPGNHNITLEKTKYVSASLDTSVEKNKITLAKATLQLELSCQDSDDGKDQFTKGSATDPFKKFVDKCINNNLLNESFCDEKRSLAETTSIDCDFECNNGKCRNGLTCNDNTTELQCSSITKSYYCDKGKLVANCSKCGCPQNKICSSSEECVDVDQSQKLNSGLVWIIGVAGFLVLIVVLLYIYLGKKKRTLKLPRITFWKKN